MYGLTDGDTDRQNLQTSRICGAHSGSPQLAFGSMMCIDRFFNHCVQYLVQHRGTQLYL